MKRKLSQKLLQWLLQWKKEQAQRLPLVLHGVRQVGKTYILKDFGAKHYKNTVYVNFEQNPSFRSIFDGELKPERIVRMLETYFDDPILPEGTLIFLDEIQLCERALTSLKYFSESAEGFHVAAAGSLPGIAIQRENASFPVGKVRLEKLHPFDFEEFSWALGKENLLGEIRIAFERDDPLPGLLHEQAMELYRNYLCVGGMPAAVVEYAGTRRFSNIVDIQTNIINAYLADLSKYAKSAESLKARSAFDSIPAQLAKDNRKFQYKLIRKGASATHFGASIEWLCNSGMTVKCRRIEHGKMPPAAYVDLSAFKLYMADVGLLISASKIPFQNVLAASQSSQDYRGALTESYVAGALSASGHDLYYWESPYKAEVDFVVVRGESVIPLEVKSAAHTRSKSLGVFFSRYGPPYAIRVSARNFGCENAVKSVPLYAAFLI
jgi:predicted AAA+ superfamily ATPase